MDPATLTAGDETEESSFVTSPKDTKNTPDIPGLPDELIEMIALNLNAVDLACFRCANQKTYRIIESFPGSDATPEDIMEKFVRLNMWDGVQHKLGGVSCELGDYTKCTRWAIMARFERDIDVEKAEKLVCCACKTKHPRSEFLLSDAELPLHICKVDYKIEGRICVNRATSTLFGYLDSLIDCSRGKDGYPSMGSCRGKIRIESELDHVCGHCMQIERECECGRDRSGRRLGAWQVFRLIMSERYECDVCPSTVTVPYYRYTDPSYTYKFTLYRKEHRLINANETSLPVVWSGVGGKERVLNHWRAVWRPVENLRFLRWFSSPLEPQDHIKIELD